MCARSIRMILLSMIFVFVAFALEAGASDHMAPAVASADRHEASSPEQALLDVTKPIDAVRVAWLDSADVDGCVTRCCQSNVCCHLLALCPFPDLWPARGEAGLALVATDGALHRANPTCRHRRPSDSFSRSSMSCSRPAICRMATLDSPSCVTVSRHLKEASMKTFISLCVVAIAAVSAIASGKPTRHADREAASCLRLTAKMQSDPSMNTWRNRMKVWPCLDEVGGASRELATVASGQRP